MTSSIIESGNISVGSYLNDLKKTTVFWDDVTTKANKLDLSLKSMSQSSNGMSDSIRRLCVPRVHNFAGLGQVTQLLSEVTATQRCLGHKMNILSKVVQNNLVVNLSNDIEPWRRSITTLKKERNIKGKKAKIDYKKSLAVVAKLEKKINKQSDRKQSLSDTMSVQVDYASQDLQNKEHFIDELDRCVLRKAICEERNRYRLLIEYLRPVFEAQLSMRDDLDELQRIYTDLYSTSHFDHNMIPSEVESYVQQFQVSDRSRSNSFTSVYSRTNSQQSLVGSNCSSPLHSINQPQYFQDNLDTSSSTLRDRHNESDNDKDDNVSEDDEGKYSTRIDNVANQTTLYPNQALPLPRYSNLRQLKQNAEKKYGFNSLNQNISVTQEDNHNFLCNVHSQSNDSTISRNNPSSRGDYITLPRNISSLPNDNILHQNIPSHYDCTFHLNANPVSFSDGTLTKSQTKSLSNYTKENDVYSSISQIYGTPSLYSDTTSGTSTFKRRKPSNVTSMELPTITDKNIYQTISNEKMYHGKETDFRSDLSLNVGKNISAPSNSSYGVDLSVLSRRSHYQSGISGYLSKDLMVKRRSSSKENDHGICEAPQSGTTHIDMPFKQQLLRVMQTSRPYAKAASPISSDIF